MSYRRFGRFASSTTADSHQRQLSAPVNKWKREWIAPDGLPSESSYKIFKWVRSDVKAQFTGSSNDYATPAPDGNGEENEGDEGEGNEEEEEGGDEEADEGAADTEVAEGEGEGEPETEMIEPQTQEATPEVPAEVEAPVGPLDPVDPVDSEMPSEESAIEQAQVPPTVDEISPPSQPTSASPNEPTHEAAIPPHHQIPSNVVEIHNAAPGVAELGKGDLGLQEGVEMEVRRPEDDGTSGAKEDEKMDVEEPIEADAGLVMGEMEPPVADLAVEGQDTPVETERA